MLQIQRFFVFDLNKQEGERKMRPNFICPHTTSRECLPTRSIHQPRQNMLKHKALVPVLYSQSTQSTSFYTKKRNYVNCCDTLKVQRKSYSPLICTASWDSFSEPDFSPSTFYSKRYTKQTDNPLCSPVNAFSQIQENDFGRELIVLVVPAILTQAIEPMAQLMETAYVGRLGPVELAAIGVSISIFNLVSKLFNVPLVNVTTSFVAEDASRSIQRDNSHEENSDLQRLVGDRIDKKQLPAVSTALVLAAALGIVEAAALAFGAGWFLNSMGIPADSPMHLPSRQYLALRALGAPAVVVSLAVQGVFRGFKDTKTPLYASGASSILNALLFPLFIFTLRFGVTGAALATVISQYFFAFVLLWNLNKQVILLPPKLEELRFDRYLKSGGLLLGRTISVLVTMTLGTSMAARQGPVFMAGHQICLQIWLAVSLLTDALALAGQALIAGAFTEGDYNLVKKITFSVLQKGLASGVALAVILFAGFESFAKLFTKDAAVLDVVKYGILFVAGSQPINALAFIFDGLHYGVSDFAYAAYSMMIVGTISSTFLVFAPSYLGIAGVWSGLALFMALRMVAGIWRLMDKNGPWGFLRQEFENVEVHY
ncbi:protein DETOXIFICATION 44, chloroplastic isoform X2 [Cryptomeria japonica]|uniref:protein DETOXIFICATION 44, chloroplastic isoform X2 n=1 Tax=Cryptomeria japonica TaxID=3369 RepID=UPI0027DA37D1|nr:protein DETOXIFICATION 44, chloroplastic isoform X2 [Cryptomeria japonica]